MRQQPSPGAEHRPVDAERPLGPTADQQCRPVLVELVGRTGRTGGRRPVQLGDVPADRQTQILRVRQGRVREGCIDVPGQPCGQLVGQARECVLLVEDDRYPASAGGEVDRGRDVATETEHHVGLHPAQQVRRRPNGPGQPQRHQSQLPPRPARQRNRRDQLERQAGRRDDGGLQAAGRAHDGDAHPRLSRLQLVRGRDEGRGVAGRAPAGEDDRQPCSPQRRARELMTAVTCGLVLVARLASTWRAAGSRRAQLSSTPTASRLASSAEPP